LDEELGDVLCSFLTKLHGLLDLADTKLYHDRVCVTIDHLRVELVAISLVVPLQNVVFRRLDHLSAVGSDRA
jgi:hypothetical protein